MLQTSVMNMRLFKTKLDSDDRQFFDLIKNELDQVNEKKVELDVLLCRFMDDIDRNLLNDCINFSGGQNSLIFPKKKQCVLEMTFSSQI